MNIKYVFANPTHNYTILVLSPIAKEDYSRISDMFFELIPLTEQVGFLSMSRSVKSAYRLDMAGGEFCGNAVLSVAALSARESHLGIGETMDFYIDASGSYIPVKCTVTAREKDFICSAVIPAPLSIDTLEDYPLVNLSGISYCIMDSRDPHASSGIDGFVRHLGNRIDVPAFGVLIWDSLKQFMQPVVYVKSTGTVVHENGCGSGSAALGSYLAYQSKSSCTVDIHQPGGTITVNAKSNGLKILDVSIKSSVSLREQEILKL